MAACCLCCVTCCACSTRRQHRRRRRGLLASKNNVTTDDTEILGLLGDDDDREKDPNGDESPYPEVRSVVPPRDDPFLPVNTVRMWGLGIFWTVVGAGMNQVFSMRYPAVHMVSMVAQVLSYPMGSALASSLPTEPVNFGPLGKHTVNPDRKFNIKEHALITIMANTTIGLAAGSDAADIIQAALKFYGFDISPGFGILLCLCCQLLGFAIAGLFAPYLIEPHSLVWPGTLGNCAILSTLHDGESMTSSEAASNEPANGWRMSRERFFILVCVAAFAWYWFPGVIVTALSYFTFICWAAPDNRVLNELFGQQSGLGLFPLTFDWSQVVYNSNPLLSPSWAATNVLGGFLLFFGMVTPALYYTNTWWTAYLPLLSTAVFDNHAAGYNATRILTPQGTLDQAAYEAYSPPFMTVASSVVTGIAFASIPAILVYTALWHGHEIWDNLQGNTELDVHARMMKKYSKVTWWWYAAVLVVFGAIAIAMVVVFDTNLPWWGVFLALAIPLLYILPCGIIQGATNINVNHLDYLADIVSGYLFTGKPLATMVFKVLSGGVLTQALFFAQDMKLGHYIKVAPRRVFFAQGLAAAVGAVTQYGTTIWMLNHVQDMCDADAPSGLTCPHGRSLYSASILWGVVGPERLFSAGQLYSGLLHFFWVGALVPVATWALWRNTRWAGWEKIHWPLIFAGVINTPPATGINYTVWALVNWTFNWGIRRRFFKWWTKYNYVLASALDVGTAVAAVLIFLAITYPGVQFPDWWGTTVNKSTADGMNVPFLDLPAAGMFGPANGTWI